MSNTSEEIYQLTKTCPKASENTSDWMEAKWFSREEIQYRLHRMLNKFRKRYEYCSGCSGCNCDMCILEDSIKRMFK